ncbi:unnamed protein product, partial [Staurois parvus]
SPRVPCSSGEGVSSQQRRADLCCTCPLSGAAKAGNRKLDGKTELGFTMRLGVQVQLLHPSSVLAARHSPHKNFSSHLASGRMAFSSPVL